MIFSISQYYWIITIIYFWGMINVSSHSLFISTRPLWLLVDFSVFMILPTLDISCKCSHSLYCPILSLSIMVLESFHSWVGQMGRFYFLAVMSNAAMNGHVQSLVGRCFHFYWIYAFYFQWHCWVTNSSLFIFLRNCPTVFCFTFSPIIHENFTFSKLSSTLVVHPFYFSHLSGCEAASPCGFNLHFPNE